jgi:hypothetical protein
MMDDSQKRKLRRTAKWLHWSAQIIIVVVAIFRFAVPQVLEEAADAMVTGDAMIKLVEPESVFSHLLVRSGISKTEQLTNYPPPLDKNNLIAWGQSVADHMDQSCAVFYFDGDKTVQWPVADKRFTESMKLVDEHLLSTATCVPDSPLVFQFGSFYLERGNFDSTQVDMSDFKSGHISIAYIGRADSPERWGVIYNMFEAFKTFVDKLKSADDKAFNYDHDLGLLINLYHLGKTKAREYAAKYGTVQYGLRVYDGETDSLVYSTPALDTTNQKIDMKIATFPYWWQVYNSDQAEERGRNFEEIASHRVPPWPWYSGIGNLFLMFVLAMLYRTVLKTTKPE